MWFPGEYFLRKSKAFLSPSLIYQHGVFSVVAWNSESGLSLLILHTSGLIYSENVVKYFCIDWNVHFIMWRQEHGWNQTLRTHLKNCGQSKCLAANAFDIRGDAAKATPYRTAGWYELEPVLWCRSTRLCPLCSLMEFPLLSRQILQPASPVHPVGTRESFKKPGLPVERLNLPCLQRVLFLEGFPVCCERCSADEVPEAGVAKRHSRPACRMHACRAEHTRSGRCVGGEVVILSSVKLVCPGILDVWTLPAPSVLGGAH